MAITEATADNEFLLSKAKYKAITGREQKKDEDVLCYQIRQSFVRGEVDAETALKIGYDLAMRWTKGNHAFFVVSHIDRPHPHVHIYYNSTSLVEVPDIVAEELFADRRYQKAHRQRMKRNKAYYSLDAGDGIENSAIHMDLSPHEVMEYKHRFARC